MANQTSSPTHRGQQWLEQLLSLTGMPAPVEADLSLMETEGSCWLVIDGEALSEAQTDQLLGNKGHALDAIQYLANTTLNMDSAPDEQCAYTIELNGYRAQRQVELEAIAQAAAQHVRDTGESYEIPSLSSAERRQVHTLMKDYDDLETESHGREPDRRLIVKRKQEEAPQ
ncbi:MAG: protein jag [Elainellaceae cyanobacterium]